jgi:hypothetical protein
VSRPPPTRPQPCEWNRRKPARSEAPEHGWQRSTTVRAMRLLLPVLLLLAAAPACTNECDAACGAQADYFERCLDTWGTTWVEQSYEDKQDYLARCAVVYGDQLDAEEEGTEAYNVLLAICDGNISRAESDTDCETLIE